MNSKLSTNFIVRVGTKLATLQNRLWVPPLVFKNTDLRPSTGYKTDGSTSLVVVKNGMASNADTDLQLESQVYAGKDNPLRMTSRFFTTFDCRFDLHWYPFDIQTCYVNVSIGRKQPIQF